MQPFGNASTSSDCVRTRGLPPAMTFTKEALVRTGFAAFCSSVHIEIHSYVMDLEIKIVGIVVVMIMAALTISVSQVR